MTKEQQQQADWKEAFRVMHELDMNVHDFVEVQTKTREHMQRRIREREERARQC